MIQLYGNQGSGNCYKVRLLLRQVGVRFESIEIDVVAGEARNDEARQRNPNGKVPVVRLEDGSYLWESGAILHYFARGSALWPDDPLEQARVLQWMFFEQYSHEPQLAVARFWCRFLKAEEKYRERLRAKHKYGYQALEVMEQHLAEHRFFAADRYSIADIALYAYTHVAHEGGFDLERFPAIRDWIDRVADQPDHITIEE